MPFKRKRTFRKKTVDKKQNKRIARLEKISKPELKQWNQAVTTEFDGTTTIDFSSGVYLAEYQPNADVNTLPGAFTPQIGLLSNSIIETTPMGWGTTIPNNVRHYARVINQIPLGDLPITRNGHDCHMMGLEFSWAFQNRSITDASFDQVYYTRIIITYDRSQRNDLVGNCLDPLELPHPMSQYSSLVMTSRQLSGSKAVQNRRPLSVLYDTGLVMTGIRSEVETSLKYINNRGRKRIRLGKNVNFSSTTGDSVYSGAVTVHLYLASNDDNVPFAYFFSPTIYFIDS